MMTMKRLNHRWFDLLLSLVIVTSLLNPCNAFLPAAPVVVIPTAARRTTSERSNVLLLHSYHRSLRFVVVRLLSSTSTTALAQSSSSGSSDNDNQQEEEVKPLLPPLTHEDIIWKIRPPPTASRLQKIKWKISANILRWESILRRKTPPTILCPNNFPQIVVEAHLKNKTKKKWLLLQRQQKIGRFGITCIRGPSAPPIGETVSQLYGIDPSLGPNLGIAAIIYMVVEPADEFRGRNVGSLALEVIALIHAKINADFTILVADDKSPQERKLVQWYERNGFARAPLLQEMMGSPNEQFGISMIAPTNGNSIPDGCHIQWW